MIAMAEGRLRIIHSSRQVYPNFSLVDERSRNRLFTKRRRDLFAVHSAMPLTAALLMDGSYPFEFRTRCVEYR